MPPKIAALTRPTFYLRAPRLETDWLMISGDPVKSLIVEVTVTVPDERKSGRLGCT